MCRLGSPLPIGPSSFVCPGGLSGLAENMRTKRTMRTKSPRSPVELSGVGRLHAVFLKRKPHRAGLSGVAWQEHRGHPDLLLNSVALVDSMRFSLRENRTARASLA